MVIGLERLGELLSVLASRSYLRPRVILQVQNALNIYLLDNKINLIIDTTLYLVPKSHSYLIIVKAPNTLVSKVITPLPNLDHFGLVLLTYLCSFISCPPTPQHASCRIREPNALSQTHLTLHAPKPLHMHLFLPEFLFMSSLILIL